MKSQRNDVLAILAGCFGATAILAAGCELIAPVDWSRANPGGMGGAGGDTATSTVGSVGSVGSGGGIGGGGGAGGMAGMGGVGGTAGMGGAGGCSKPADCPQPPNECIKATCLNNTCGTMNEPQGMKTPTQVEGDCMINECSGTGTVNTMADATDPANDMKECTTDTCKADGMTMHTSVNAGTACSEGGGKVCNNAGACVECITMAECTVAGEICQGGNCVEPACANAMKDGSETDVDCGGPECNPCGTNKTCMAPKDCISVVCIGNKCQQATCSDLAKNGTETDVDCGGASCPKCGDNKVCLAPSDCQSGVCSGNKCGGPTCMDTVKNGAETDVDCGGATCLACADGQMCSMSSDCMSGNCAAGACAPGNDGGIGGSGGSGGAGGN